MSEPKDCPDCDGQGSYAQRTGENEQELRQCENCNGTGSIEGITDEPEFSA